MEIIDDKAKLLGLINSIGFKSVKAVANNYEIVNTYNPFDVYDVFSLYFDNGLIISFDKHKGVYVIKIGKNSGWIAGLETESIEYSFDIDKLDFDSFKQGLLNAVNNQKYCLVSKYNSGNIHEVVFTGSIDEIRSWAAVNGYEVVKNNQYCLHDFHLYNENLNRFDDKRILSVVVLSSVYYENIMCRS